jgi:hypothetical protein
MGVLRIEEAASSCPWEALAHELERRGGPGSEHQHPLLRIGPEVLQHQPPYPLHLVRCGTDQRRTETRPVMTPSSIDKEARRLTWPPAPCCADCRRPPRVAPGVSQDATIRNLNIQARASVLRRHSPATLPSSGTWRTAWIPRDPGIWTRQHCVVGDRGLETPPASSSPPQGKFQDHLGTRQGAIRESAANKGTCCGMSQSQGHQVLFVERPRALRP